MKGLITLIIILFTIQSVISQDFSEYFIEINNEAYIPKYDEIKNVYLVDKNLKDSRRINAILTNLDMRDCVFVNDIIPNQLNKNIHVSIYKENATIVEGLLNQLVNNYNYFINYKKLSTGKSLYTPNDFENAIGLPDKLTYTAQDDLIMMRAQEAWDITKGDSTVLIGISDTGFDAIHPDLESEIAGGIGNYNNSAGHGTAVFGLATGATNNGAGSISSIGFNTKALLRAGSSSEGLKQLSFMGAKVVNASFGWVVSTINNNSDLNEIINNETVIIAAAGNGPTSGGVSGTNGILTNESYASRYYFPASYRDVISVSTVGNVNEINFDEDGDPETYDNWKDIHLIKPWATAKFDAPNKPLVSLTEKNLSFQHNDSVDIVVAAYRPSPRAFPIGGNSNDIYRDAIGGTSSSAPLVAGTVGLMFSVNYCLAPNEVETILKLTAVKIDTLPLNLPFYGRLGAGRLDAYEAVKMANDMAEPFGTVEVKNRILYRPWFYKLVTAPYEIKMFNNEVIGASKLKFRARNNIEILSGEYVPDSGGYIDLQIDENLVLNDCPPPVNQNNFSSNTNSNEDNYLQSKSYLVFPTLVDNDVSIVLKEDANNQISLVKVYDLFGLEVFEQDKINAKTVSLNLFRLPEGIYIIKVYNTKNELVHTQKIVKQ